MRLKVPFLAGTLAAGLMLAPAAGYSQTATSWSSDATNAMQEQGCDPAVVQRISQAQDAEIRAQTTMAHQLYDYLKNLKTNAATCLNSLMPHMYFGRGGLGDIWGQIGNAVCSEMNQMAEPTIGTINGGVSNLTGNLSSALYKNLSLGNGAINLGSVPMGLNISNGGGQLLNTDAIVNSLYDNTVNGSFNYTKNASSFFKPGNALQVYGLGDN